MFTCDNRQMYFNVVSRRKNACLLIRIEVDDEKHAKWTRRGKKKESLSPFLRPSAESEKKK